MYQLLKGVQYCHENNIVHRDIKPENILISKQGILKLCDFGFARTLAGQGAKYTDYVATRWYRAPELLVGDTEYGKPVDIWAIGCNAAELSNGIPLFPGESDIDQLFHILRCFGRLTQRQVEIFRSNPLYVGIELPKQYDVQTIEQRFTNTQQRYLMGILVRCLHYDPENRQSCAQLLRTDFFTDNGFDQWYEQELKEMLEREANPLLVKRKRAHRRRTEVEGPSQTDVDQQGGGAIIDPVNHHHQQQQQQQQQQDHGNITSNAVHAPHPFHVEEDQGSKSHVLKPLQAPLSLSVETSLSELIQDHHRQPPPPPSMVHHHVSEDKHRNEPPLTVKKAPGSLAGTTFPPPSHFFQPQTTDTQGSQSMKATLGGSTKYHPPQYHINPFTGVTSGQDTVGDGRYTQPSIGDWGQSGSDHLPNLRGLNPQLNIPVVAFPQIGADPPPFIPQQSTKKESSSTLFPTLGPLDPNNALFKYNSKKKVKKPDSIVMQNNFPSKPMPNAHPQGNWLTPMPNKHLPVGSSGSSGIPFFSEPPRSDLPMLSHTSNEVVLPPPSREGRGGKP
eukprot:NODE_283_length_2528_cov_15.299314_g261_i0.p1 GENE.NODE_283_length_2528_cov_15.299314_g261_i0~~NODE_283_length_2528_cov_15.299314_g261_i0.p1  ORF type:complete len:560 (-),score=87.08 NODE_283_length_2528_cov_15.299314_g261_i0:457-2136(-)